MLVAKPLPVSVHMDAAVPPFITSVEGAASM